jgi:hypothetical protein
LVVIKATRLEHRKCQRQLRKNPFKNHGCNLGMKFFAVAIYPLRANKHQRGKIKAKKTLERKKKK